MASCTTNTTANHINNKTDESTKTFAFFDIETTGLPEFEFFKTKIVELTIVACSKEHILQTPTKELPRILHKLSICINPSKLISPRSTEITMIDNFLVEQENKFNENVAVLLTNFLQHLQQPVCLVAHNGFPFDFPILRKELLKFDLDKLNFPKTLKCVDSLPIFRKIDDIEVNNSTRLKELNDDDEDGVLASPINEILSPELTKIVKNQNEPKEEKETEICDQKEKDFLENRQKINETTPSSNRINSRRLDNHFHHHRRDDISSICSKESPKSDGGVQKNSQKSTLTKRKLLDSFNSTVSCGATERPTLSSAKKKFTLIEIYKRLNMNKEPEISHYAEADTINLLKCVIQMRDEFFKFVETDSILFSDVKDLGKK